MFDDRFDRQIAFFGAEGQARLAGARVAIVGLGGTGSHVAQQLAFLGIRSFDLIDYDIATSTNLNRLIGSRPEDVALARRKTEIIERLVREIASDAEIRSVPDGLLSHAGFSAVRAADVAFGCLDKELPRLILVELTQAYEVPYIDIATEIDAENTRNFGGRVVVSVDGERCLFCSGVIDQDELRRERQSPAERAEEERIYGVRREDLGGSGPSVVFLNGLLASAAVTEFVVAWTGLRPARPHLEYRGAFGVLAVKADPPAPGCPYCKNPDVRGQRDSANVERWLSQISSRL